MDCYNANEEKEKKLREVLDKRGAFSKTMWSLDNPIPKRFIKKTLDNYQATKKEQQTILRICRRFSDNFDEAKENGTSLVFCGRPGTGKTHLAYAIIERLRDKYVTAIIKTASDMTSQVKDAYKSDDTTTQQVVKEFSFFDLLIIDEVGIQTSSEAEKRIFFDIINKRYENMLPTILISNLELQELTAFVGERVMDRMKENGGVIFAFDWDSHR